MSFRSAAESLIFSFLSVVVHAVAENVVVLKELVAELRAQLRGGFDELAVAFPGLGVEQFLLLFLGQTLLRAPLLFFVFLFVVAAPVGQAFFQRGGDLGEFVKEVVAELFVELGAQFFVAGSEAERSRWL